MLIEAGFKIMPKNDKGKTHLDYAEYAEMIKLLKAHGVMEELIFIKCCTPGY